MYKYIINPKTNRMVNINSIAGKKILNNYLNLVNLNGGATSKTPKKKIKYQLITDVDDTLIPSGWAAGIAGVDSRGKRGEYYPCVKKIHRSVHNLYRLPSVIVSANPKAPSSRKIKSKTLALHGFKPHEPVTYYNGSLISSTYSVASNLYAKSKSFLYKKARLGDYDVSSLDSDGFSSMARQKINTIEAHVRVMRNDLEKKNIEVRHIWIGDNGQGDLIAARELLNRGLIFAAFIHYVDETKPSGEEYGIKNLFSFPTYKKAIIDLKNLGVLPSSWSCSDKTNHAPILARQKSQQMREKRKR